MAALRRSRIAQRPGSEPHASSSVDGAFKVARPDDGRALLHRPVAGPPARGRRRPVPGGPGGRLGLARLGLGHASSSTETKPPASSGGDNALGRDTLTKVITGSQRFLSEVARFKAWAASLPPGPRNGEWECDDEHWSELRVAFEAFLGERTPEQWTAEETEAVLYAVARDNEVEIVAQAMSQFPGHLLAAARASVGSAEPDAKWQLAEVLTETVPEQAHAILEVLSSDGDEYVRRRVLLLLGRLRSPLVEALVDRAWETGNEYQRIAALYALHDLGSARLQDFLSRAEADGRKHLVENARKFRGS
jgi:hypothetical protein